MPWITAGGALVGGLGGATIGGLFGSSAAKRQADALRAAVAESQRQYDATVARLAPWVRFGQEQLNAFSQWLTDPTKQPFSYLDPGYDWRRSEGLKGLYGNAAAAGLLSSGDTLRAALRYGQDLASSEYQKAFDRWLAEGTFRQGLAGMGQSAASNLGYIGQQYTNTLGNLLSQRGAAEAAGQMAIGRSLADALTGGSALGANLLARYLRQPSTSAPAEDTWWIDPQAAGVHWDNPMLLRRLGIPGGPDLLGSPYMMTNAAGAPLEYD